MPSHRSAFSLGAAAVMLAAALAACGGGGSTTPAGSGYNPPPPGPTPAPTTSPSNQQIVTMALPNTAIGTVTDPTFGLIGGFTQQLYSQVLAFPPASRVMIRNGQSGTPHTFGVVSTTSFDSGAALSTNATGGSTIQAGFNTGSVNGGTLVGPFTLVAGTYYVGCAFHYSSNAMRTVLQVGANATPGPQATPPAPTQTAPPAGGGGFY